MRVAILIAALAVASGAAAQDRPAGAVDGAILATPQAEAGGAVSANLWVPIDWFRIGALFGAAVMPSANDAHNRVFMPLALSLATEIPLFESGLALSLRAYGGMWGGATQEVKLTAGGLIGGGAFLQYRLGSAVSVELGLDAWGLLGAGSQIVFAPSLGISWGLLPPPEAPSSA